MDGKQNNWFIAGVLIVVSIVLLIGFALVGKYGG